MPDWLLGRWKWLLSFRSSRWLFEDYPVRVRRNPTDGPMLEGERWSVPKYLAQIINWWQLSGSGDTPEEAVDDLRGTFAGWVARGEALPRPGARVPLAFASANQIESLLETASEFFPKILDMDLDDVLFLSDESTLWDFTAASDLDEEFSRIREAFGVDVSGVVDGNLVRILRKIESARASD